MKKFWRDKCRSFVFHSISAAIVFLQFAIISPAQIFSQTVEIAAVGDVLLARGVGKKIE